MLRKVQWLIVLLPNASRLLCACAFSHVFQLLPDCSVHHSQLCILCSSTRKSLSVISGVWMCPWGAVHLRQAYSFLPLSIITYCILEEAPASMPCSQCEHFLHLVEKETHMLCDNITGLFSCSALSSDSKCVWLGTSTVCQAGYPAVLLNINLLLNSNSSTFRQVCLSSLNEIKNTYGMLHWC